MSKFNGAAKGLGYEWGDGRAEQKKRTAERAAAMAVMRPEYSYRQIGERFGVGKQWVAQMLEAHGYTEAMGHRLTRIEKICLGCGADFGSTMPPSKAKRQKFCHPKCRALFASNHMTDREREVVMAVLMYRAQGKTWRHAAELLRFFYNDNGTGLPGYIIKAAAKENIDVSAAFGLRGK